MDFIFLEVTDKDMLEKVFAFRYKVICETKIFQEYVSENSFENNKESDMFDPYSVQFAVLDEGKNICATVRLIYNSPHGYPTENNMKFDKKSFERDKLGE